VRQARIQLATVLSLAVLYNAPKFAEARIEVEVDPADNSTWLMPHHTALGLSRLYNVVYGNVCYTLFLRSRAGLASNSLPPQFSRDPTSCTGCFRRLLISVKEGFKHGMKDSGGN